MATCPHGDRAWHIQPMTPAPRTTLRIRSQNITYNLSMRNIVPCKPWLERQEAWLLSPPLILANDKDSLSHFISLLKKRREPIRAYTMSSLLLLLQRHHHFTLRCNPRSWMQLPACSHIHQSSVGLGWACQGRSFFSIDTFDDACRMFSGLIHLGAFLLAFFFSYISAWRRKLAERWVYKPSAAVRALTAVGLASI